MKIKEVLYIVEICQILAELNRGKKLDRMQELSCLYVVNEPEDFMEYDFVCSSCVVESWPINSGQTAGISLLLRIPLVA